MQRLAITAREVATDYDAWVAKRRRWRCSCGQVSIDDWPTLHDRSVAACDDDSAWVKSAVITCSRCGQARFLGVLAPAKLATIYFMDVLPDG